ncbi:hypothetical protein PC119_g9449 [Phytophthora cactorum]|uniref:Uncharacterized protein n=1 Tax=Phytophthora cactorum TaxID=29920 RepID=A0A8T1BL65_9STRA|nr:hypothetical protein PC111_g14403 [Phytophthora cactorum]KAG2904306.1 hypothetical protein PC115_g15027 [Phytophthora cactorum]KAG3021911.1 hypothetical protein PC119_g9449 [Phytophthora cactorum]KAG4048674.1 hypothetical protein PC123_g16024 [Phytophthora cactorum]
MNGSLLQLDLGGALKGSQSTSARKLCTLTAALATSQWQVAHSVLVPEASGPPHGPQTLASTSRADLLHSWIDLSSMPAKALHQ